MSDKTRIKAIAEWMKKEPIWLAEQLWSARKNAKNAREEVSEYREKLWKLERQNDSVNEIQEANKIMADVLEQNGIRPTRLRLTYIFHDCDNCKYDEDDWYVCDNCDEEKEYVESISFYTYKVHDGFLEGITSQFKEEEYELVKLVDERTGEVIGEWKKDD